MASTSAPLQQLYTVVKGACQKKASIDDAIKQIKEILKSTPDAQPALIDALVLVDDEIACKYGVPDKNDKTGSSKLVQKDKERDYFKEFRDVCTSLIEAKLLPEEVALMSLEHYSTDAKEIEMQGKRRLQIKTRMFYKQEKFNLLREENEGYAKLLVDLCEQCENKIPHEKALKDILCLIGQFKLDPNRVTDVVLEVFERSLDQSDYLCYLLRALQATSTDICNLLGFKFQPYQQSILAKVPTTLYDLAAELVKCNIIDLTALIPHLAPTHASILEEHRKREKIAKEKASKNAKPMANIGKHEQDEQNNGSSTVLARNQKLGVLCALIERDCWDRAREMLRCMPEYYPFATCDRATDVFTAMIERNLNVYYNRIVAQYSLFDEPSTAALSREEAATLLRRFVPEFVPKCFALGPYLGRAPRLHMKLTRCILELCTRSGVLDDYNAIAFAEQHGRAAPEVESSDELLKAIYGYLRCFADKHFAATDLSRCVDIIDESLLPALTVMVGNAPAQEQLWKFISQLPYFSRYSPERHAIMAECKQKVKGVTSYYLKRLAKETVKATGRQLCKVAHTFPSVVFDALITQVQTFDNFVTPTVDSLKNLTPLEYDILTFTMMCHLCAPEKQKLKASDAALSPWLTSLSTFVAQVFKRYTIDLIGVLQYIANELKDGNSFDLLILHDVVLTMSGVEVSSNMSQDLIQAACGGPLLLREGGRYNEARNVRRATARLRDALSDENLALSLCILIAQQHAHLLYGESSRHLHLKLLSQLVDQCQETFDQFGSFLRHNMRQEPSEYLPRTGELITQYHLTLPAAMFISRARYLSDINKHFDALQKAAKPEGDDGKYTEKQKQSFYDQALDKIIPELGAELRKALAATKQLPTISYSLTPNGEYLTAELSSTIMALFWVHTSYYVHVPHDAYKKTIEKIKVIELGVDKRNMEKIDLQNSVDEMKSSGRSSGGIDRATRREISRLDMLAKQLHKERQRQHLHAGRFESRLASKECTLHRQDSITGTVIADLWLRYCILPRAKFSELDAVYVGQFMRLMHKTNTGHFPTLHIIFLFFRNMSTTLLSLTENEVNAVGILACEFLELLNYWHSKPNLVQEMINNKHESLRGYHSKHMTTETVFTQMFQVHFYLSKIIAFKMMSGGNRYIVYRNALLFLMKILPHYPLIQEHNDLIVSKIEFLINNEKQDGGRQDLLVLATSYLAHLKKRQLTMIKRIDFGDEGGKSLQAKEAAKEKAKASPSKRATVAAEAPAKKADAEAATPKASVDGEVEPKRRKIQAPEGGKTATAHPSVPKLAATEDNTSARSKSKSSEGAAAIARTALADGAPTARKVQVAGDSTTANGDSESNIANRLGAKRAAVDGTVVENGQSDTKKARADDERSSSRSHSRDHTKKRDKEREKDERKSYKSSRSHSREHRL